MALHGDKSVLILVPKILIWQWQDELDYLLDLPVAVWDGRNWIDENELKYLNRGTYDILKCPRRIGIITVHPFENRYKNEVKNINWESCSMVLKKKKRGSISKWDGNDLNVDTIRKVKRGANKMQSKVPVSEPLAKIIEVIPKIICIFRQHSDNDSVNIKISYRNYPDSISETSGHIVELTK